MSWKRKVKPDLPLDRVPLSYKPGKPHTTGKVISGPDVSRALMSCPEYVQRAKEFWVKWEADNSSKGE